jgi:hypothetical protein
MESAMHLRIVRGSVKPGQLDAFVARWREGIGSQLPSVPGFQHGHFAGDREANTVVGVTLWETPPGAAMDQRIQEFAAQAGNLLAGPPQIEDYEVLVEI